MKLFQLLMVHFLILFIIGIEDVKSIQEGTAPVGFQQEDVFVLDGRLYYDIEWRTKYQTISNLNLSIRNYIIDEGQSAYIPTSEGDLVSISSEGSKRWDFNGSGDASMNTPMLFGGKVHYITKNGLLYCLSCSDGSLEWCSLVSDRPDWVSDPILCGDGKIVVLTSRKDLTWFYPNGSAAFTYHLKEDPTEGLIFVDRDLNTYVSAGFKIHSFDSNGSLRWIFEDPSLPYTAITQDTLGRIVAASYLRKVICMTSEGEEVWRAELSKGMISDLYPSRNGDVFVYAILTDAGNELITLDVNGTLAWRTKVPDSPSRPYFDRNGNIMLGGFYEMLLIDPISGACLWTRNLWEGINPIPIGDDRYVTLDRRGSLICTRGYVTKRVDFEQATITQLGIYLQWYEPQETLYPIISYEVLELDEIDGNITDRHTTERNCYLDAEFEYNRSVYYRIIANTEQGSSPPSYEFWVHPGQGGGENNYHMEIEMVNNTVKVNVDLFPKEFLADQIYYIAVMRMDETENEWVEIGRVDLYLSYYIDENPTKETTNYYRIDIVTYEGRRISSYSRSVYIPPDPKERTDLTIFIKIGSVLCGAIILIFVLIPITLFLISFNKRSKDHSIK